MSIFDNTGDQSAFLLWQEVIQGAEARCAVSLKKELEVYLIRMLVRYTHQSEMVNKIFATTFLEALQQDRHQRKLSLQQVGDQCLIIAGLFPQAVERRLVKISYFVTLGQSAYLAVSNATNDLFNLLGLQFVILMDVLQSVRPFSDLLPLQAYEQWQEVGSQRALKMLQSYTQHSPLKTIR